MHSLWAHGLLSCHTYSTLTLALLLFLCVSPFGFFSFRPSSGNAATAVPKARSTASRFFFSVRGAAAGAAVREGASACNLPMWCSKSCHWVGCCLLFAYSQQYQRLTDVGYQLHLVGRGVRLWGQLSVSSCGRVVLSPG